MIICKRPVHCQAKEDNEWQSRRKAALSMLTMELKQIAEFS